MIVLGLNELMPDQSEKERRKELLRNAKNAERLKAESELPASKEDLRDLLGWVDRSVGDRCDHTMRYTLDFIRKRELDEERVVAWLRQYGGYCDCEVAMNVADSCPAMK
jgi:hypothetical protein